METTPLHLQCARDTGHFTRDSQAAGPGYVHQVGLPGSGQRTWPRTLELRRGRQRGWGPANLETLGAWGRFRVTCAAIKDRSMVLLLAWLLLWLPALQSSLLLLLLSSASPLRVQPPAQLSGSGRRSEQVPSGPGDRDLSSPGVAAPFQPSRRPRWRLRAPAPDAEWAGDPGRGAPPRDHSQPHPRGRAEQDP